MPIVGNRYYNDEALGQGFSNLAAAFAPPSGSDASGYALANQRKIQNDLVMKLATDPRFQDFDHLGVLADLFDPNASFSAVDQNNATQRYGYDQTFQASRLNNAEDNDTARYGHDLTAETSRLNSAAENTRAVVTSAYGPLKPGEIRPEYPSTISDMYGLPAMPQIAGGPETLSETQVKANILSKLPQNQQEAAAMGDTPVELTLDEFGNPVVTYRSESVGKTPYKPLSLAEQQARERQDLIEAGALTPDMQLDTARMQDQTAVKIVDANGVQKYVPSGEAVRTGAAPAIDSKGAPETQNYRTADGKTGKAYFDDQDKTWKETTPPHVVIPQDAITYNTSVQGGVDQTINPKPTEASDKAAVFYSRAAPASDALDAAIVGDAASGVAPYLPSDADYEATLGALSGLPNAMTRHVVSPEGRKFYDNAQNFMMAMLRPDTGAAFGKDEFQSYARVFIPMPGDDPAVIANKAQARATALAALQGTARGADVAIAKIMQENGLPVPPEMAAVIARGGIGSVPAAAAAGGAPAAAAGGELPVFATPEEAATHPSGTRFRDPEGNERVVP